MPEGAHEDAAAALELRVLLLDRLPERLGAVDRAAVGDLDVLEALREPLEGLDVGERAVAERAHGEQRRGDPVAGRA